MKNLGKIIIFLTFLINISHASVTASVDSLNVVKGEMVTLSLKIDGKDIKQPNIQTLCGEDVISSNSQTSIEMINGSFSKNYILSYKFLPQKSCKIEPIEIEIDGKKEYTDTIEIKVGAQKITKDSSFILTLESSANEVFVGESFDVTLLFKQKNNVTAVDSEFVPPSLQGFWVKNESKPVRYKDGDYTVTKMIYTLAAQREGVLKISQAQMKIASRSNTRDSWGMWMPQIKWRTYFSNELDIKVKKLPSGIDLVGDFKISSKVDKTSIEQNEAVNMTVEVIGDGNLEDITTLKPSVSGVSVFDEKIEINGNRLTQKIAFVSGADFTIPSISLRYFNPSTKEIKSIQTKEYNIDVKSSDKKAEATLNIKRQDSNNNASTTQNSSKMFSLIWAVFIFLAGVAVGIIAMLLKEGTKFKNKNIFDIKDEKKLLVKLLPFKDDKEVQEMMDKLESNIYSGKKEPIDKKALKELVKRLGIS